MTTKTPPTDETPLTPTPWDLLTNREMEVALMLARGDTNREIAKALGISIKTVDTHRIHAIAKLKCKNNVGLARMAIRDGKAQP